MSLILAAVIPAVVLPELTSFGCGRGWCGNGNVASYVAVVFVLLAVAFIFDLYERRESQRDAMKYLKDQRQYWKTHAIFEGSLYRLIEEGYEKTMSNKPDFPPLD